MSVYYRGTNNRNEDKLIATETIHCSVNHLTNSKELGLSVSDVSSIKHYFKFMYELSGVEIGIGADGEPLLDITSLKFIRWITN